MLGNTLALIFVQKEKATKMVSPECHSPTRHLTSSTLCSEAHKRMRIVLLVCWWVKQLMNNTNQRATCTFGKDHLYSVDLMDCPFVSWDGFEKGKRFLNDIGQNKATQHTQDTTRTQWHSHASILGLHVEHVECQVQARIRCARVEFPVTDGVGRIILIAEFRVWEEVHCVVRQSNEVTTTDWKKSNSRCK